MAGILFLAAWLLTRGRVGRAWRAIRDGDVAATSSGVNPALYKVLAFGISSFTRERPALCSRSKPPT